MPVKILELIIKTTVCDPSDNNKDTTKNGQANISNQNKEAIVSEAVEQVLEILRQNKDR